MRRSRNRVDIGETNAWALPSPARSPEQQALDQEAGRILQQAVHRLPSTYRPVFLLCEMENLSIAETAQA
jgi:DNA-directed RNA polymerase specialized sigma24 family protein